MIKLNNITVFYNDNRALDSISLNIYEDGIIGIIGPNGAGKSTLLKAMLDIVPYYGEVLINGEYSKAKLRKIAYVEQKTNIDYTFPIKVKECVSLGIYSEKKLFQKINKRDWNRVKEALRKVDLVDYSDRQIGELSGGQFQRVLLARCLVQNADYIFLDEPFVGIDSVSEKIIMNRLRNLKKEGKTILIVHHDLSKIKNYFDKIIILNKNLIAYGDVMDTFNEKNLKDAYGENIFIDSEG